MATTTVTSTVAAASTEAEPREYIVLLPIENVSDEHYVVVGRAKALRKEDALDEVVDKLPKDEQGGPFIAIAARYWVEMTPEIEPPPPPKRSWK